jgi:hypothetical protein
MLPDRKSPPSLTPALLGLVVFGGLTEGQVARAQAVDKVCAGEGSELDAG